MSALADVIGKWRRFMLDRFEVDTCILASIAIKDALENFGVEMRLAQYQVLIANYHYNQWVNENGGLPQSAVVLDEVLSDEVGGHSVGIGFGKPNPDSPDGLDGHLVGIVELEEKTYLVDGSLDQARRERKGVLTEPFVIEISSDKLDHIMISSSHDEPTYVFYNKIPDAFAHSPDFKKHYEINRLAMMLVGLITVELIHSQEAVEK